MALALLGAFTSSLQHVSCWKMGLRARSTGARAHPHLARGMAAVLHPQMATQCQAPHSTALSLPRAGCCTTSSDGEAEARVSTLLEGGRACLGLEGEGWKELVPSAPTPAEPHCPGPALAPTEPHYSMLKYLWGIFM